MLRRFEAEGYPPEAARLMEEALDAALAKIRSVNGVTRNLLASAVMDCVDAGVRDRGEIADQAAAMLAVAENLLARAAAPRGKISAFEFECGGARSWTGHPLLPAKAIARRRPGAVLIARIGRPKRL